MRIRFFSRRERKLLVLVVLYVAGSAATTEIRTARLTAVKESLNKGLYEELCLEEMGLRRDVFERAITGWQQLCAKLRPGKEGLITIADLSQSANSKRLYVIDLEHKAVLFNTYVAHGRNSGDEFARSFANRPHSFKSSLGFFITGEPYKGAHGLSLRLHGGEKGINDRALERGIVVHGASYVSEKFIRDTGRLGRSQGCPAVPDELCKPIVECIKDGSCVFLFYPDSTYFEKSEFFAQKIEH